MLVTPLVLIQIFGQRMLVDWPKCGSDPQGEGHLACLNVRTVQTLVYNVILLCCKVSKNTSSPCSALLPLSLCNVGYCYKLLTLHAWAEELALWSSLICKATITLKTSQVLD